MELKIVKPKFKEMTYRDDLEFMKRVLPTHYTCEFRKWGIHCYSSEGIPEDKGLDDHWDLIMKAIKQNFGERFQEVFHQTCTDHLKFTVYLKRDPEEERRLRAAEKIARTSIMSGVWSP